MIGVPSMEERNLGTDFQPLYRQVKALLIKRVMLGDWKPGEAMPSETRLATEFRVSQGTVRKAIEEMAAEHIVVRHQGKGTFVTGRTTESRIHFFSMSNIDHEPVVRRTMVSMENTVAPANKNERKTLKLEDGEKVFRLHRVRAIDGKAVICEDISMADRLFPGFGELLGKKWRSNTYLMMEEHYGVLTARADEWLNAVRAGKREAKELDIKAGDPLMEINRISFGLDGNPIDMRRIRINSREYLYYNSVR